jgi:hypothetical protein
LHAGDHEERAMELGGLTTRRRVVWLKLTVLATMIQKSIQIMVAPGVNENNETNKMSWREEEKIRKQRRCTFRIVMRSPSPAKVPPATLEVDGPVDEAEAARAGGE